MQPHLISSSRRANSSTTANRLPTLPRLPVPDLHKTLRAYLKSLEPLLLEDEAKGGPDFKTAYDTRLKLIEDFESGLGQLCHQRLLELDQRSPHNWLDDNIWLQKAYHEWRAPLIVNSNWWLALGDDPIVPQSVRHPSQQRSAYNEWQVRRATWLVYLLLEHKWRLDKQEISRDTTRTGLWFKRASGQCFHTCRIPQRGCDRLAPTTPANDPNKRKLLVMVADWIYAIEVTDEENHPLHVITIEKRLNAIVQDVVKRRKDGERVVPVSVLTTDERDRWADNLEYLLSLSPDNRAIYNTITSSAFALSLDDYAYALPAAHPSSDPDLTAHLHNIRSGCGDRPGHNRWYDKPFTLIVEQNTRAGVLGEHSPVDALVPSVVADYATVHSIDEDKFLEVPKGEAQNPHEQQEAIGWERLDWIVDEVVERECKAAAERAKAIVDDSDVDELVFNSYGVDWIKKEAHLPPDGFIQMALQLAWYRTRGEVTATYETALTRLFKHGRTETIRALSTDSRAWVLAMADPQCSNVTRFELLQRALQTHTSLTRLAMTGRGIDRHLLGLQVMMRSEEGESHALFEDELFKRSQTWKLSTSGLTAGDQFRGTGFGAGYHDGYGINYMPAADRLRFGIESKHSCAETGTELFKAALTAVLEDMRTLCTATLQSHL